MLFDLRSIIVYIIELKDARQRLTNNAKESHDFKQEIEMLKEEINNIKSQYLEITNKLQLLDKAI